MPEAEAVKLLLSTLYQGSSKIALLRMGVCQPRFLEHLDHYLFVDTAHKMNFLSQSNARRQCMMHHGLGSVGLEARVAEFIGLHNELRSLVMRYE